MKWEYLNIVEYANRALGDSDLDYYGERRWELVTVCPAPNGNKLLYIFKRQIIEP